MLVDVKNCSSCGGNHRVQTVEQVNPNSLEKAVSKRDVIGVLEAKRKPKQTKKANRFFYCPRTGSQIFVKLEPGQKEIDLNKVKDAAG
jgi:hypothetical protein